MAKPSVVGAITRGISADRAASSIDPNALPDKPGDDQVQAAAARVVPPATSQPPADAAASTPATEQAPADTIPVVQEPPKPEFDQKPSIPPRAELLPTGPARLLEIWSEGRGTPTSMKGVPVPGGVIVITEQAAPKAAGGNLAMATTFVPGVKMQQNAKDPTGRRWELVPIASKPTKV